MKLNHQVYFLSEWSPVDHTGQVIHTENSRHFVVVVVLPGFWSTVCFGKTGGHLLFILVRLDGLCPLLTFRQHPLVPTEHTKEKLNPLLYLTARTISGPRS
jgi:hypothetical protein